MAMAQNTGIIGWLNIKRPKSLTPSLGSRELAVLEILWQERSLSAQQVLDRLVKSEGIGLSTVQSTLERLHRKKLLKRVKLARAYYYQPEISRNEIVSSLLHDITAEIAGGDLAPVVSGFINYLEGHNTDIESAIKKIEPSTANSFD